MSLNRNNLKTKGTCWQTLPYWSGYRKLPVRGSTRQSGTGSTAPLLPAPFPCFQLLKLKNHHLAKLENKGLVTFFEKEIGEIKNGMIKYRRIFPWKSKRFLQSGTTSKDRIFSKKANSEKTTDQRRLQNVQQQIRFRSLFRRTGRKPQWRSRGVQPAPDRRRNRNGTVTDVCLKRKIRNFVQLKKQETQKF